MDPETSLLARNNPAAGITRKHAILLLSSLLLQDYIKWRGLLFHRFLVACSDEDEQVAALAESVLSGPLCTRQPKLFFNHFVEALFVLNKCTAHPIYIAAASQGDGGSGIAVGFEGIYLNGELGRLRRRRMYEFMLSKLSDEEKIGVTARLAKEILAEAVSQEGDLSRVCQSRAPEQLQSQELNSAWNVLTDAFYILTTQQLKVGKADNEEDNNLSLEDPNVVPNANRQVTMAKTRLLSKISRKHLIEIVLPIVCQLKTQLQASCSPLLKDLQLYLLDIFRRYKKEAREFLANDPLLLQELEYDARQHAAGVGVQ
jgi:condensin-2 complex subunit D3